MIKFLLLDLLGTVHENKEVRLWKWREPIHIRFGYVLCYRNCSNATNWREVSKRILKQVTK